METKKYYTPLVEEFHVGFEYSIKNERRDLYPLHVITNKKSSWKTVLKWPHECIVKYLDKEDIESLGWKFKQKSNYLSIGDVLIFTKIDNTGELIQLFLIPIDEGRIIIEKYGEKIDIIIKNKSEFKKLMQQLELD